MNTLFQLSDNIEAPLDRMKLNALVLRYVDGRTGVEHPQCDLAVGTSTSRMFATGISSRYLTQQDKRILLVNRREEVDEVAGA